MCLISVIINLKGHINGKKTQTAIRYNVESVKPKKLNQTKQNIH